MALREVLAALAVEVAGVDKARQAADAVDRFASAAGQSSTPLGRFARDVQSAADQSEEAGGAAGLLGTNLAAAGIGFGIAAGGAYVATRAFHALEERASAAVHAIAAEVQRVTELGDEIGDASDRLGISAQQYQRWRYIAEQTGSSVEAVSRAFVGIARGSTGATHALRELHVATRTSTGAMRSQDDVFTDAVSALSRIGNSARQAALAQRIFGRAGAELLPLIRQQPGEIDRLRRRFQELGGGLSDDVVANANDADQAFRDFRLATEGARAELAGSFLPAVTRGVTALADWVAKGRAMVENSSAIGIAMKAATPIALALGAVLALAAAPVLILGGALLATGLVIEDFVTGVQGGRSVIFRFGDSVLRNVGIGMSFLEVVKLINAGIARMTQTIQGLGQAASRSFGVLERFGSFSLGGLAEGTTSAPVRAGLETASSLLGADAGGRAATIAVPLGSARGPGPLPPTVFSAQAAQGRGAAGEASRAAGRAAAAFSAVFNITGSSDPEGTARAVDRVLQSRIREFTDTIPAAPAGEAVT